MSLRLLGLGILAASCVACVSPGTPGEDVDDDTAPLSYEAPVVAALPSGTLAGAVVEIADESDLPSTLDAGATTYIHARSSGAWYFETGRYLLGVESFVQFHQDVDAWISFGTGSHVAPERMRVVARRVGSSGWSASEVAQGAWAQPIDGVWIAGTNDGVLAMGAAPDRIPVGTVVVGSMQAYGGNLSTPWLFGDVSTSADSTRIRKLVHVGAGTQLGGHSAGSSTARRIALDVGVSHVFLYGTPNYTRKSGAYAVTDGPVTAEVINNPSDPVTNCLAAPWSLVSIAWGTAKCHDYAGWDYTATTASSPICGSP